MLRVPQIILFYVCLLKTIKKFVWRNQVKTYNDIIREENAFIEIRSLLLEMILDLRFYDHCVLFNVLLYYLATFLTRCRFTFSISNLFSLYNTNWALSHEINSIIIVLVRKSTKKLDNDKGNIEYKKHFFLIGIAVIMA